MTTRATFTKRLQVARFMSEDAAPLTDDAPSQGLYVFAYLASMAGLLVLGIMYW